MVHEVATEVAQRERERARQQRQRFDDQQTSGFVKQTDFKDTAATFTAAQELHIADAVQGGEAGDEFSTRLISTGQLLTQDRFVTALKERGWQFLGSDETGNPSGSAWTEAGALDKRGHTEGWKLARSVETEVRDLVSRIGALVRAGWTEVVVVTDHGWLLVPGGLPKVELKSFLAETRWSRCAALKSDAQTDAMAFKWHWNPAVMMASPPGAGCFRASLEYSHGGVSLQEMVTPVLRVKAAHPTGGSAQLLEAKWTGAKCRVLVGGRCAGVRVDVRTSQSDPNTSLLADKQARETTPDGKVTVFLENDSDIGKDAEIVLLDASGQVIDSLSTALEIDLMSQQLDPIDTIATKAFEGYVVRKDLVRKFKGQYPIPTYVAEFLLGRYCASVDDEEIAEGLKIVERQLGEKTIRAGEHELFKARAKDKGHVKLIDIITARLDAGTDSFLATLPSLQLKDVRIGEAMVHANERMLTGGFYAEVELAYDPTIAQEKNGRPFGIDSLREIQLPKREVLPGLYNGREAFATEEWKDFLIRSIGMEPDTLTPRARDMMLLRMVPFVERNYNMVELGPRGTGKSHLFQQVSPYAHLISGGKATVARMFVNNAIGQRGLVCQYDVVCFDEISGVSFDQKDGVNIMKGYMESGEFSRGKESIRADGGIVMVGNFEVDVQHQQRVGHLFGPLSPEMRDDTAFMDRIHAYLPGWDLPKVSRDLLTNQFGLVSDFLSECWNQLRRQSRQNLFQGRIHLGGALSGRDTTGVQKTVSGLIKLVSPNPDTLVPDEVLEWASRIALECRRRVKEQQKRIGSAEFRNTQFSYSMGDDGVEKFVSTPELYSENSIGSDPLPPGQAWVIAPGGGGENPGLYRVDITEGPGSGVKILNHPAPPPFRESVRCAEQNLYVRAKQFVGDRDPRQHEFSVQLRAFDSAKSGSAVGVGVLLALCSSLLQKSIKGGLAVTGGLNLGGSIETIFNPVAVVEIAIEKGADSILMPISSRRQLNDLPDDLAAKITVHYYLDARDALLKALAI